MGPLERNRLAIVPPPSIVPSVRRERSLDVVPAGLGLLDLVESLCRLRVLEAWAELRLMLCDDARLESIAARGIAGPEATIEAMRFAAAGDRFTVCDYEIEPLEKDAALVRRPRSATRSGASPS